MNKNQKLIWLIASKLQCEGITQSSYTIEKAKKALGNTIQPKRLIEILIDNEQEIKDKLNGAVKQQKLEI